MQATKIKKLTGTSNYEGFQGHLQKYPHAVTSFFDYETQLSSVELKHTSPSKFVQYFVLRSFNQTGAQTSKCGLFGGKNGASFCIAGPI